MNLLLRLSLFPSFFLLTLRAESSGASKPHKTEEKAPKAQSTDKTSPDHFERQLLVAFENDKLAEQRSKIFKKYEVKEIEKVGAGALYLVEVKAGEDLKKLQTKIAAEPGVRYAEPNVRMKTFIGQ